MYAALSLRVADDDEIRALAGHSRLRQPPVNLLFGAVHHLLLAGVRHDLAQFYPSVDGRGAPEDAWPVFRDFCRSFEREIVEMVATRRVQTNEPGRCGLLLPAFGHARRLFDRPLFLIEVGASAGLNLLFDQYRYEYSDGRACGPPSTVVIRTELRGPRECPVPDTVPEVAGRIGVDIAPVDVTDAGATRWIEALIWPDELDRIELHRKAVATARAAPPRIIGGDALDVVPDVLAEAPPGATPCVYHSHTTCQMSESWRRQFAACIARLARDRDLVHISLEWLKDDPGPQLHFTAYRDGHPARIHMASCHHHGRWMTWLCSTRTVA